MQPSALARPPRTTVPVALHSGGAAADAVLFASQVAQLALLVAAVRLFEIESAALPDLLLLVLGGFVAHHLVPGAWRLPVFALLSLGSIALILGPVNAAWLVGIGGALVGLAHLPAPFAARAGLIAAAGLGLAVFRQGFVAGPVSGAVWPILGSMFMFRMMAYLYDLRHRAAPFGFWRAMAYFFMVPNVAFPLFPVVDYKAFVRSHYNDKALVIYQTGLVWMMRGAVQLILYRMVYQNLMVDPAGVTDTLGAARYMLATYLLYLKVSGTFHFIVGLLHLFGFNLSETHHKYLLASSFTDFWRRINIYWKDFIEKLFFKPAFFWLGRRTGRTGAMIGATAFAFLATWLLHSYQWFWIRGDFPLTWQDAVFWWLLGALVVVNLFVELKAKGGRSLKPRALTPRQALGKAASTAGVFASIVVLWSLWSAKDAAELGHLVRTLLTPNLAGLLGCAGVLLLVGAAGVWSGRTRQARTDIAPGAGRAEIGGVWRSAFLNGAILGAIVLVGWKPNVLGTDGPVHNVVVQAKFRSVLSGKDKKVLERGYYEDLTNVERFSPELATLYDKQPPDWAESDAIVTDHTRFPYVGWKPSTESRFRGVPVSINRWGMRDRDYALEKPPGVFRMVLLGSSHSAGSGVAHEAMYETLVEDRLNREAGSGGGRYELLNFSMGGFGALSKLATLEQRVRPFSPDLVLFEVSAESERIVQNLTTAVANHVPLPYAFATDALAAEGITDATSKTEFINRMLPHAPRILRAAFARADSVCRASGARLAVVVIPETNVPSAATLRSWEDSQAAARELGIPVLDLTGAYAGVTDFEAMWVAPWDRHPGPDGHRMLADTLYPLLLDAIGDVAAGAGP